MARGQYAKQTLGSELYARTQSSRVLMVGAGGIGCELLKNLVLGGFGFVQVIDLDTIDLSNLNRQFLFQRKHIKSSKAHIAVETARSFNPEVKLESTHGNIKDPKFDVAFFKSFDIVLNALDNLDARRHVNMLCIYANVPLVESGTTGYLGQVQVIVKDKTECYDCTPKPMPKTFPVCTIRSTPSTPIHCIVWAKNYLFSQLFGIDEDDSGDLDKEATETNAQEIRNLKQEAEALKRIKESIGTPEFPKMVFEKVFSADIKRLLSMEDMWKNRQAPIPLEYDHFVENGATSNGSTNGKAASGLKDQQMWSLPDNVHVFLGSVQLLSKNLLEEQKMNPTATLAFDKDDDAALDFVTATSNLRAHVFGIETKTRFQVKEMAGNIIPAIATTNAIVAGMIVLEAYKVLAGHLDDCRKPYVSPRADSLFTLEGLSKPNPRCPVCRVVYMTLEIDTASETIAAFVSKVMRSEHEGREFGLEDFSISEGERLMYDPDFDDNEDKTLAEMGILGGKMLTVVDEGDKVPIVFGIVDRPGQEPHLSEKIPEEIPSRPPPPVTEEEPDDDEILASAGGTKRKASDLEDATEGSSSKKVKTDDNGVIDVDETIETEEGRQDLIVLDD